MLALLMGLGQDLEELFPNSNWFPFVAYQSFRLRGISSGMKTHWDLNTYIGRSGVSWLKFEHFFDPKPIIHRHQRV
jgi:hypothetical protein